MSKQEMIQQLTALMVTVQMAHFKGRETGVRVHETGEAGISIDLYNFEGDGKPVCEGLKPCKITCGDGSTKIGQIFCMVYDPDEEEAPLVFLFSHDEYGDEGDMDIGPEEVPKEALQNITQWLERAVVPVERHKPKNDVTKAKEIIALWSDWCMDWDVENVWLNYMAKHPKGHCNRQHLQEKWDYCYKKYGSHAAMTMFWRELDDDNRTILTEYITTQWHKS